MNNMNFTCDVCGREIFGCNIVNGMKFCAKCYQETFGANKDWQLLDKDKEIANLKSQLAITEKALELACETLQDINFKLFNTEMNFVDYFKQEAKEN